MEKPTRLLRSKTDRIISGVCGGLGKYFDIEPWVFRIIFLLLLFKGIGLLIYIILWIVIPQEGEPRIGEFKDQVKEGTDSFAHEVTNLSQNRQNLGLIVGLITIFIGFLLLIENFFPFGFDFDKLWPLILIVFGILILAKPKKTKGIKSKPHDQKENK